MSPDINCSGLRRKRAVAPRRPCPYCQKLFQRLTGHIRNIHKNEPDVKKAMSCVGKESRDLFKQMKRSGIITYNVKNAGHKEVVVMTERRVRKGGDRKDGTMCDICKGIFSKSYFYLHKQTCTAAGGSVPQAVPLEVVFSGANLNEEFTTKILSKFLNDEAGQVCKTDKCLLKIGERLYEKMKAKRDKKMEVKRSVMSDMRRLANLFLKFKEAKVSPEECSVIHMFQRDNFDYLERAIKETTIRTDNSMKSGLKVALFYLIKKACKIVKGSFLVAEDDASASEVGKFVEVLELHYNLVFGDAMYQLNTNRCTRLRKPEQLPLKEEIDKLRLHSLTRMANLTQDPFMIWTTEEYGELRDIAASRITLFNARRGGEVARLKLTAWEDCVNNVWVPSAQIERMNELQQELAKKSKLMYLTGKGMGFVPVLVPMDTVDALVRLSDKTIRNQCHVRKDNEYLFPNMQASSDHISGWHALKRVCVKAEIDGKRISATRMRHYISTLYSHAEVPENRRSYFLKHIGHSEFINENVYQVPQAQAELLYVGELLHQFDQPQSAESSAPLASLPPVPDSLASVPPVPASLASVPSVPASLASVPSVPASLASVPSVPANTQHVVEAMNVSEQCGSPPSSSSTMYVAE